jgi:CheY-like chemotaxis protein
MPILIADDDADTVTTQALLLRSRGYEVLTCVHGNDVMPMVEEHHPRALLLDLSMPQMNGFDVAQELHDNPDLRPQLLVAITGYGDDKTKERTAAAGFDYHLLKPVNIEELAAILDRALV